MDDWELINAPAEYRNLGMTVFKFRSKAKDGIMSLSRADRISYGDAIEKAVKAKQRSALQRELPGHKCQCASGTNYNTGEAIHKAIQDQQRSSLLSCPAKIRKTRTDAEWLAMYAEAMREKPKQMEAAE